MDKNFKVFTFKGPRNLETLIKDAIQQMPQIAHMSEFIRQAIFKFAAEGPTEKILLEESSGEIIKHLANLLAEHENRMATRVMTIHDQLGQLLFLQKERSNSEEIEIGNFLDMITESLFIKNLESTIKIHIPGKLIPLLQFEFHADYLSDWLKMQEDRNLLKIERGKIIWFEEDIRNIYNE